MSESVIPHDLFFLDHDGNLYRVTGELHSETITYSLVLLAGADTLPPTDPGYPGAYPLPDPDWYPEPDDDGFRRLRNAARLQGKLSERRSAFDP